jgi:hypothetical protein
MRSRLDAVPFADVGQSAEWRGVLKRATQVAARQ